MAHSDVTEKKARRLHIVTSFSALKDQSWESSSADLKGQRRKGGSPTHWILLAPKKAICPRTQQQGKAETEGLDVAIHGVCGDDVRTGAVPPVPGQHLHTTF